MNMIPKHLTHDGVDVMYRVAGDGHSVVMVPSLGRGSEDFDALVPLLVDAGLRVILPEPRGIEGSEPLRDTDTLHDMASDIAAITEAEGAAPAFVVGHAAGNWVARVLAHDRPDLIRGVILITAILTNVVPEHVKGSISASFDMTLPEDERLKHLQKVYFAPRSDASVWLDGWWPEVSRVQRRAAGLTLDKDWLRVADRHRTLYIAAAQDVISPPPDLAELRDKIGPNTDMVTIADAGHALLPEQSKATAQAILDWINELGA